METAVSLPRMAATCSVLMPAGFALQTTVRGALPRLIASRRATCSSSPSNEV